MTNSFSLILPKRIVLSWLSVLISIPAIGQLYVGASFGLANPAWTEGVGSGMAGSIKVEYPLAEGMLHVWGQLSGGRLFLETFSPDGDFVGDPANPYNAYYFDGFEYTPVYTYNRTFFSDIMAGLSLRALGAAYAEGGIFTPYVDLGIGLNTYHASLDMLDAQGEPYEFDNTILLGPNGEPLGFLEYQWQPSRRDGTYETPAAGHSVKTDILHHQYQVMWLIRMGVNLRISQHVHLDGFLSANTNTRSNWNVRGRVGHDHGQVLDRYFRAGIGVMFSL